MQEKKTLENIVRPIIGTLKMMCVVFYESIRYPNRISIIDERTGKVIGRYTEKDYYSKK